MKTPLSSTATRWMKGGVLIAAALPVLLGADGPADPNERHRQDIARLSKVEREELVRQWRVWQELDESERQQLRQLHADLQADRRAGGQLAQTLDAYKKWLNQLTPWQRQQLRAETDPLRKAALVDQFDKERIAQREARQRDWESRRRSEGPLSFGAILRMPVLPEQQLTAAMTLIESTLPVDRDAELRRRLASVSGPQRQLTVLAAALEQAARQHPGEGWPDPRLLQELRTRVDEERFELLKDRPLPEQQSFLVKMLVRSITDRWWQPGAREPLTHDDLVKVYESMSPHERDELERMPERHRERDLRGRWIGLRAREIEPQMKALAEAYKAVFPNEPAGPPPRGDGRGPRGRGERPSFEHRP